MTHLPILVATLTLFCTSASYAEVREIKSMREVITSIDSRTLTVFDIDNTITEPLQTIGSDQFFGYLVELAKAQGLVEKDAVEQALQQASQIQPITNVRAVESFVPALIAHLQRDGVPVVGLTARPIAWASGTLRQLRSIHVNLFSAPKLNHPELGRQKLICTLVQGVLFMTPHGNKGECLIAYIEEARLHPDRIVFVDDKVKNVNDVEAALMNTSFAHFSFRYGAADQRVAAFDKKLAHLEWNYFLKTGLILSDSDARQMMREQFSLETSARPDGNSSVHDVQILTPIPRIIDHRDIL